MTGVKPIRVAVAGAAGQIGYSLCFRIAAGSLFGPGQPVVLQLLELHCALPQLEASAMELKDSAYPLLAGLTIGPDLREIFRGRRLVPPCGSQPLQPRDRKPDRSLADERPRNCRAAGRSRLHRTLGCSWSLSHATRIA